MSEALSWRTEAERAEDEKRMLAAGMIRNGDDWVPDPAVWGDDSE